MTWSSFFSGLREAASATGMLYIILIGAFVFSYFVTIARIPEALVQTIDALTLPPLGIVVLILASVSGAWRRFRRNLGHADHAPVHTSGGRQAWI